jgi:hypothetical protein
MLDDVTDVLGEQGVINADGTGSDAHVRQIGEHPAIIRVAQDVDLVVLFDTQGNQAFAGFANLVVELGPGDAVHFTGVVD